VPKTDSERTRDKEARKKAAGLHEYRVYAPAATEGGHDPEVKAELNACADKIIRRRAKPKRPRV
jgi:hypothetical protein